MVLAAYSFLRYVAENDVAYCGLSGLVIAIERYACVATWLLWGLMWLGVCLEGGWEGWMGLVGDVVLRW